MKIKPSAEYSGLSQKSLRTLLKKGLRHSRLPSGTVLIKLDWLDQYFEKYEVISDEEPLNKIVRELEKEFHL